jgi:cold shock CspA family protein
MLGTMLWFNVEKGYGFIQTEDGERLYVARDGFLPKHEPKPRCKGREVSFNRQVRARHARSRGHVRRPRGATARATPDAPERPLALVSAARSPRTGGLRMAVV